MGQSFRLLWDYPVLMGQFLRLVWDYSGWAGCLIILLTPILLYKWLAGTRRWVEREWVWRMMCYSLIPLCLGMGGRCWVLLDAAGVIGEDNLPPKVIANWSRLSTIPAWEGIIATGLLLVVGTIALTVGARKEASAPAAPPGGGSDDCAAQSEEGDHA